MRKLRDEASPSKPVPLKKPGKPSAVSDDVRYTAEQDSETEVNEVPLTEELIESFLQFLDKYNIELRFFAGGWQNVPAPEQPYDLVLTSETVYELDNLEHLTGLLHRCALPQRGQPRPRDHTTLVACKRVYFGVGGGEHAFKDCIEKQGATVDNIWNSGSGVERTVMRVNWAEQ